MNPVLLLFLPPVLTGLLLLLVTQSKRRQRFVQRRLTKVTADPHDKQPEPFLVRKLHRAPIAVFQLPRKVATWFNSAFEAAGNRVGLSHLLITGLISAIIVIV